MAEEEERVKVIQRLLEAEGTEGYGEAQRRAARELGVTVRSVQRLVRRWREGGIAGIKKQVRSDRGSVKISAQWEEYILKTYREGNRGSRRMSRAQVAVRVAARAAEIGDEHCPSRTTVYRILKFQQEQRVQSARSLGWRGKGLRLKTRSGEEISIDRSNQVWQVDHTLADVLLVDQSGELIGRPWLTLVVDSYSRCIMGLHLGIEAPSAWVVCLALRHAILPKQYSSSYELQHSWGTYGIPRYLYTDSGKDFKSEHIEQVATELGIICELRRYPSEGGIVERPFGTLNSELFSTLPGYTESNTIKRPKQAEASASLMLMQLEKLIVRYIVDRYNQSLDARMGDQTRIGRWEAGCTGAVALLGERELDICLMRQERRVVYRGGYIQFANLTYRGEHLSGYAGESVVIRYNPRDITSVLIYQLSGGKEAFIARAHAQGLETESIALLEAQAISRRVRAAGRVVSNQSVLEEVQRRDSEIKQLRRRGKGKPAQSQQDRGCKATPTAEVEEASCEQTGIEELSEELSEEAIETVVRDVVVHDYEELKRNYGKWW